MPSLPDCTGCMGDQKREEEHQMGTKQHPGQRVLTPEEVNTIKRWVNSRVPVDLRWWRFDLYVYPRIGTGTSTASIASGLATSCRTMRRRTRRRVMPIQADTQAMLQRAAELYKVRCPTLEGCGGAGSIRPGGSSAASVGCNTCQGTGLVKPWPKEA